MLYGHIYLNVFILVSMHVCSMCMPWRVCWEVKGQQEAPVLFFHCVLPGSRGVPLPTELPHQPGNSTETPGPFVLGFPFPAVVVVEAAVPQEWEAVLQQTSGCGASGKGHAVRLLNGGPLGLQPAGPGRQVPQVQGSVNRPQTCPCLLVPSE